MKARAYVLISGKVQGVFFRSKTQARARETGVAGWVKNLRDGRVEAVFEGEREAVEEMVRFCKVGPLGAQVKDVKTRWEAYTGEYENFKII